MFRRISWSLADQVVASATNFGLTVLVARSVPPAAFGEFSILVAMYVLTVYLARGLTAEPLVTRYSTAGPDQQSQAMRASTAATACFALVLAAVTAASALFVPDQLRGESLAFAAVLPGVLIQDHLRYAFFAEGHPSKAFLNDLLWMVTQFAAVLLVVQQGIPAVSSLILAWGGAGALAAGVGLLQLRQRPTPSQVLWWFRAHKELWRFYAVENSVMQVTNLIVLTLVAVVAGLDAAGGLRAAVAIFGPLTILALGALSAGVPELARVAAFSVTRMARRAFVVGCLLAGATLLWGSTALILPATAGETLFGDTWTLAEPILLFTMLDATAAMFVIGPFLGLRVLGSGLRSLRVRTVFSVARLVMAGGGALLGGAQGAVIGFAIIAPVQMLVWSWQFRRACRAAPSALALDESSRLAGHQESIVPGAR